MLQNTETHKLFIELCNQAKESQDALFDFVDKEKYKPSMDDNEVTEEASAMVKLFFSSLSMIPTCHILFDKIDLLEKHKKIDILALINELRSISQRMIEAKSKLSRQE